MPEKYKAWAKHGEKKARARDDGYDAKKSAKQVFGSPRDTRDKNTATWNALAQVDTSRARRVTRQGLSVEEIARRLGKRKSRIYEYLR